MKKFYLKDGKEVSLGDIVTECVKINNSVFGKIDCILNITVTEKSLPFLIEDGIITVKESPLECKIPMELNYYVDKIAGRLGCNSQKVIYLLDKVSTIYPPTTFSILLKEIAIELDKLYDDHIKDSPEIYVVSTNDGRISKINKAKIKNYRNFAAFRSIEDARIACRILKPFLKEMYASK